MKIVVAVDSFKDCLSSVQVANAVECGINAALPNCEVLKIPLSDGGEGFADTIVAAANGRYQTVCVHNPLMKIIDARYGIVDENIAVIEMAAASGLMLISPETRNPMETTTFGTGELICDAVKRGLRNFVVGIGGSATNDAGLGMLQALGFRFSDAKGNELSVGGKIMQSVETIDTSKVLPELENCKFRIACDVQNTFCGHNGAAYIFAPQKGATPEMVAALDEGMKHVAKIIQQKFNVNIENISGAGAAGGLGGAFVAFLNAELLSGIDLVLQTIHFNNALRNADLVITGEGKIDAQSLMGKALQGVLKAAKKQNTPVVAICGRVEDEQKIISAGVKKVITVSPPDMPLEQAMHPNVAMQNIKKAIQKYFL